MRSTTKVFIRCGLRQAGILLLLNLLLAALGGLSLWLKFLWPALTPVLIFSVSVCSGPVPSLLTLFDITDHQLYVLWGILVIPYWTLLGIGAGIVHWKKEATHNDESPASLSRTTTRQIRWTIGITALVISHLSCPTGPILGPVAPGPRQSVATRIINNLRQIDAAMQQLALVKSLEHGAVVTKADLSPFLNTRGRDFFASTGPERYVLGHIGEAPYAVLDTDWRIRRRGWREGYTVPKGTEYRLPTKMNPQ